ncbi:MAG: hypothetical protein VZT48_09125 [Bulleidia sp.]|nr:hypothetical protein [Bulleidia sp.]
MSETEPGKEAASAEDVQMHVPEDFSTYSSKQKEVWFLMYYGSYVREGEVQGIREDAPQDVKEAFEAFLKEEDCPWHDSVKPR